MAPPEDPNAIDPDIQPPDELAYSHGSEQDDPPPDDLSDEPDLDSDEDPWGDGDRPEINYDMSEPSLRAKQFANYEAQLAKGNKPIIGQYPDPDAIDPQRDLKARTYNQLTRTFFPLILDDPRNNTGAPQKPWTFDEIFLAMNAVFRRMARSYGTTGERTYQPDDAESDAHLACLKAIQSDGGLSPFGRYAAKQGYRSAGKGSKGANTEPVPVLRQRHGPSSSSLDKNIGATEKTGAGIVPTTAGSISRGQKCPACGGAKDPKTKKPVPCDVCDQRGFLVVTQPRPSSGFGTKTPATEIVDQEQSDIKHNALIDMLPQAGLTERQTESMLLRFGLEGLFHPGIESTNDVKLETAIGRILGAADMIYKKVEDSHNQVIGRSGYWADATDQGRTDEFQQIWDKVFGSMTHQPFDPEIPASLQISVLYQLTADREPTEKELAKKKNRTSTGRPVWPPRDVPQENLGKLYELMLDLYNVFGPGGDLTDMSAMGPGRPAWKGGGPPVGVWKPNSKKSVQIKIAAAKKRLDALIASGEISSEYAPDELLPGTSPLEYGAQYQDPRYARKKPTKLESVNIILDWLFELMLEDIIRGEITSIEDIDRYDQAITT